MPIERIDYMILAAPLQGYTEVPWRRFHREIYGEGIDSYFTPFIRVEDGEVRPKDLKDTTSELNEGVPLVPQIIFKDAIEFQTLVEDLKVRGFKRIDLNLGCPFPPQVKRGRGSGCIVNRKVMSSIFELIQTEYKYIRFSIKMRLGAKEPDEWQCIIDAINQTPLEYVALHPRIGSQQYKGELNLEAFRRFLETCRHPLIFNGEIHSSEDIARINSEFSDVAGVMIGRGLLARPSLAAEYCSGKDWSREVRLEKLLHLHQSIFNYYQGCLCGESQILQKIKPFWDYIEPEIGHKAAKAIKKSITLSKYMGAVNNID